METIKCSGEVELKKSDSIEISIYKILYASFKINLKAVEF